MMKFLILTSMVVFPTVANAQYHSLSGEPVHNIPAFSWVNPGWSEGRTDFNASHHVAPTSPSSNFNPAYNVSSGVTTSGGGSVPPSRLNNDFGNMD